MTRPPHVVVMVTTSYPRFPGDGVGSFIEPIAKGVAARGHAVHIVAPWHPRLERPAREDGVVFHFYRYALTPKLNVFGYAEGLHADEHLRAATLVATPTAVAAAWFKTLRVAQKARATVVHAQWVVPNGVIAAAAVPSLPLVVSLHGSDVFVAERHRTIGRAAAVVFRRSGWVTACSEDLRQRAIALGAAAARTEVVPYGVDGVRFAPSSERRTQMRRRLGLTDEPVIFTAGRLVAKKGFEYLIDAAPAIVHRHPRVRIFIAGDGDLAAPLGERAHAVGNAVTLLGNTSQDDIASLAAAADAIAVPSVVDAAGNVDGLPNFALEALASGTPVVATRVGGLPQAIVDGQTGRLVNERDAPALADALSDLLTHRHLAQTLGAAARSHVLTNFGWPRVAERLEAAYDRASGLPVPGDVRAVLG